MWIEGVAREVGPVVFAGDLGTVDELRFAAECERARRDELLVFASDHRQPFGTFAGTLPGGVALAEGFGVMERHRALVRRSDRTPRLRAAAGRGRRRLDTQSSGRSSMIAGRSGLVVGVSALALAGGVATVVGAQEGPPTVVVELRGTTVTFQGAEALRGGPTRFVFRNADRRRAGRIASLLALRPGKTIEDVRAALKLPEERSLPAILALGSFAAGTSTGSSERATTLALDPGTTYVMAETSNENAAKFPLASFVTTAETSTAVAPAPAATVRMVDFGFRGASTLPRNGTVRFTNEGAAPHFAVAFRLRRGANSRAATRALSRNQEKRFARYVAGAPTDPQGIITAGAVNDQELKFSRAGRYLLVCFFSTGPKAKGHHELGMIRTVRVK